MRVKTSCVSRLSPRRYEKVSTKRCAMCTFAHLALVFGDDNADHEGDEVEREEQKGDGEDDVSVELVEHSDLAAEVVDEEGLVELPEELLEEVKGGVATVEVVDEVD